MRLFHVSTPSYRRAGRSFVLPALAVALTGAALSAAPFQQAAGEQSGTGLEIVSIEPATAEAGDSITLRLSSTRTQNLEVYFGRVLSKPIEVSGNMVRVRVPTELLPGVRPGIVVRADRIESPPNYDFEVAPLTIAGIEPTAARPGQSVLVSPSRQAELLRRSLDDSDVPVIEFGGKPAAIEAISSEGIRVRVPETLEPGERPDVVLKLGAVSTLPFRDFQVTQTWWEKYGFIAVFLAVMAFAAYGVLSDHRRQKRARLEAQRKALEKERPLPELILPPLEVPEELVEACAQGNCVLFAGAGLGARAGFPIWKPLVDKLLEWAIQQDYVEQREAEKLRYSLDRGDPDAVADGLVSKLKGRERQLHSWLESIFGVAVPVLPKAYRELARIDFRAVLSANFDDLLERAFVRREPKIYTLHDFEKLLDTFSRPDFYILKLYGLLERPDTVIIAPAQYKEQVQRSDFLRDFNDKLFFDRSLLFIGASLDGIEDFIEGVGSRSSVRSRHFALVGISEAGWEARAEVLDRRYGIQVIPYRVQEFSPQAQHGEVQEFVEKLAAQVRRRTAERKGQPAVAQGTPRIDQIKLRNIGPFDSLDLDLDPRLTILLGDNGVGKSTILKALAIAVAGKAGERYAERFIKSGAQDAEIFVRMSDSQEYVTTLTRTRHGVELKSNPRPPCSDGETLVLGFPPLRTVARRSSEGPQLIEGRESPRAADVLPIITSDPDPRISDLNQWFLNLDYLRTKRQGLAWVDRLFDSFFRTLGYLLGELRVEYDGIDPEKKQILFRTDDGKVPLDALSQGTVSVIGWIGVFLQRLYEIYEWSDNLRDKYVLVLIDELDAHMHPEWQQVLVDKILTLFSKPQPGEKTEGRLENIADCQFIVTTHSPFIVAGREADQIVRLRRDDQTRKVVVELPDRGTEGLGVSSILTSSLFGLDTALDPQTQSKLIERRKLAVKEELTPKDKERLAELNRRLQAVDVKTRDPALQRAVQVIAEAEGRRLQADRKLTKTEEERLRQLALETIEEMKREEPS